LKRQLARLARLQASDSRHTVALARDPFFWCYWQGPAALPLISLIAIIFDIHGNIDALEAVLEDIDQHNTDIVASWRPLMARLVEDEGDFGEG